MRGSDSSTSWFGVGLFATGTRWMGVGPRVDFVCRTVGVTSLVRYHHTYCETGRSVERCIFHAG